MKTVLKENPEFNDIPIKIIDEILHPITANKYDYWLVPTYYVDGKKVYEGASTFSDFKKEYDLAFNDWYLQ